MRNKAGRILVFGEHGQVAQALDRECAARGYFARLAGRCSVDLTDSKAVSAVVAEFRPQLIVNAAAYTAVDKAEDETIQAYQINRDGASYVADAAVASGAPLIHISTDYVYDGAKTSQYVESDPANPVGVYGASKLAGEMAVSGNAKDFVILRTSWVCSPDGNNFVKTMLRLASQREEIGVVDDQWGAPTFAADLARTIVSIGETLMSAKDRSMLSGVYHATGSGETTWCRFAQAIMAGSAERQGPSCRVRAITTLEYPTRARRPTNSRLDCSKLARVFGIRMPAWETSLKSCLDQLIPTNSRVSI